jgi:hypothetical protein
MKRTEAVIPALALFAILACSVGAAGASPTTTTGFAVYKVQLTSMGVTQSFTVNESISPTPNVSYDKLTIGVVSGSTEFNYSRSINSSLDVAPLIPAITNQTFSYKSASSSASVAVAKNGTVPVAFHGASYKLASYSVVASFVVNGTSEKINGALEAFPSGLVYFVTVSAPVPDLAGLAALNMTLPSLSSLSTLSAPLQSLGGSTSGAVVVSLTLLSTSMPLNSPTASPVEQVASIGIGAGAAVTVLALGLGVRHRRNQQPEQPARTEYSVD